MPPRFRSWACWPRRGCKARSKSSKPKPRAISPAMRRRSETRAWLAAVFSRESSSPDFINHALAAIAATTPADVQRVARTYLGNPTIAFVLPRANQSSRLVSRPRPRLSQSARRRRARFRAIARAWPEAPVYTALYDERQSGDLVPASRVRTSYLAARAARQSIFPRARAILSRAFESFDLSRVRARRQLNDGMGERRSHPPRAVHVLLHQHARAAFLRLRPVYRRIRIARSSARPFVASLAAWDKRAALRPTHSSRTRTT